MSQAEWPRTQFFQACRGVFEGGGCRGAAHIGAYEAAVKCGVNFSEVAGTSAGSIVAALVGAGATPEYLLRTAAYLQFSELLADPKGTIKTPWTAKCAGYLLPGLSGPLARIARRGAAYSSEKIQTWVDERLSELLPDATRPIKFKDLILPTWIVATDLAGRRAKVWSTKDTPEENVAFAVRASCSIPLFFEPVSAGNDAYVDGGMLSNLPSFVFAENRKDVMSLGGRVLCFRLLADKEVELRWDIAGVVKRLLATAIDGATEIQKGLLQNVSEISIPTGDVASTEFEISKERVHFLLNKGRHAVREFVANEHRFLDDAISSDVARQGPDELYDDLAREMAVCGKRMLVSCDGTRWFWELFPSVASWAIGGASIQVFVTRDAEDGRDRQRRAAMQRLGISITRVQSVPFFGFVLNRADDKNDAAFVVDPSENHYSHYGAVYVGARHRSVIRNLTRILEQLGGTSSSPQRRFTLKPANPEGLISLLKNGVSQYSGQAVSIRMDTANLRNEQPKVRLIVRRVRSYKYRQMETLASIYGNWDLPFASPADIFADGQLVSTITPPVLEEWGDDLVAVEGNTRIFYSNWLGKTSIPALIVRGVTQPLPGIATDIRRALIASFEMSPAQRISGLVYDNFRSIEGAVRPEE